MKNALIYLDHAAATPLDARARQAMEPYFDDLFFNPSSPYAPALEVRHAYEAAKDQIARLLGATADELVMTAGATESINLAFSAVTGHVVTTEIEHQAVLAAAPDATRVPVDAHGRVSVDAIARALRPDTQLVSVGLANNEIGTIQPLREIAALLKQERQRRAERGDTTPLFFHTDASQGLGALDVHVARLGVDMMTLNAGKVYGPKQVGLLWVARHVNVQPLIRGGGQERGLRSGTENVAGVIGFAEALKHADGHKKFEVERLRALRDLLKERLLTAFPDAVVSGHPRHQLPHFLHVSFSGIDAERVLFLLEMAGVLVATGSACAANKGTRSHVLTAIGLHDEVADGSLRMSLGKLNDEASIIEASAKIIEAVTQEKERMS